ncbi:hypothetical protein [Aliikangiella maris]|uniref:Glycosyltransferase RgtA/B/C/D-like domain-containing protein n=2 Tax=Aliikangiella maris TaxID=3162458 RepID=A0ABV2BZD0_9GAMM
MNGKINYPLLVSIVFLLCLMLTIIINILVLNDGLFVFTLDDPYIHMALAENIKLGHYGINVNEFSAPSSSILWPFIITPLSSTPYGVLVINLCSTLFSVYIFSKILNLTVYIKYDYIRSIFFSIIIISFILATNMVGLVFTGMEHSLQLLIVLLIIYGLLIEIEKNEVKFWWLAAIVVAPLIRYECMAISLAAIIYLVMCRRFNIANITLLLTVLFIGSFSVFLISLGLDAFPSSVVAKSPIVQSGGAWTHIFSNLEASINNRQGTILFIGALSILSYLCWFKDIKKKKLALVALIAVLLHFIAGRYGWYNRYEIYILAFEITVNIYLFLPLIAKEISKLNRLDLTLFKVLIFVGGIFMAVGAPYIYGLSTIHIASNNIYEQQYQMHRFAVDFYNKPIAVNDLGYVSYNNNNYVLDLWGLGSLKALNSRLNPDYLNWKQDLINTANVNLVMIYDEWFNDIPSEWIKIGELHLGKKKITPAYSEVSFYVTNQESYQGILEKIVLFTKTLPNEVYFQFSEMSN